MEEVGKSKEGEAADDNLKLQSKKGGTSDSNTPRKRVSQACDRCRIRKDKCDGKKPICGSCTALGQPCSWEPSTKKRGLPEGYVRGLEKLWGLTIRETDGLEDNILSLLEGAEDTDSPISRAWNERNANEFLLLETWRKSRISRQLEKLLPVLECNDDKGLKRKRQESTVGRVKEDIPDASPSSTSGVETARYATQAKPVERNVGFERAASTDQVELPSRTWQLLDVYFSYTQCWLPVVEKHNLLKTSYQYPLKSGITCYSPGSGDHAALWAVLAFADHQYKSFRTTGKLANADGRIWPTDELYKCARALIPPEDGDYEIGHVQALLILSLFNMGKNQWKRAWLLIGQTVRIAIDLHLGEVESSPDASSKVMRRKQVFLSCFTLDTLISNRLNRKPHLRTDDLVHIGLVDEDGLDEWDPWTDALDLRLAAKTGHRGPASTTSTFNRLVRVVKVLNDLLLDKSARTPTAQKKMLAELESCSKPSTTPLGNSDDTLLPHRFHLRLAHLGVMSLLPNNDGRLEDLAAYRALQLLKRYLLEYQAAIIPPTIDCFLHMTKLQENVNDQQLDSSGIMSQMIQAWPTFANFTSMRTVNQESSPIDSIMTDSATHQKRSPSKGRMQPPFQGMSRGTLDRPNASSLNTDRSQTFSQTPLSSTSSSQFQFESILGQSPSGTTNTTLTGGPVWQAQSPSVYDMSMGPPNGLYAGPMYSENDVDSMFNEFATLDAMKWANNWDQSLLNLGFTDPDNMNQDFLALVREPDPHYATNLQQLLSNTTSPQLAPSYDDSLLPFPNPHVEASQILQALSAAEDHRSLDSGP